MSASSASILEYLEIAQAKRGVCFVHAYRDGLFFDDLEIGIQFCTFLLRAKSKSPQHGEQWR